jgi:hypothetical protein
VGRTDDAHEIVIKHPDLKPNADRVSRIVFLPRHARHLASLLMIHAAHRFFDYRVETANAARFFRKETSRFGMLFSKDEKGAKR